MGREGVRGPIMPEKQYLDANGNTAGANPPTYLDPNTGEPIVGHPEHAAPAGNWQDGTANWQKAIDAAAQVEPYSTSKGVLGNAKAALNNLGAGAVSLFMEPIAHPLDTVKGMAQFIAKPVDPNEPPILDTKTPIGQQLGMAGAKLTAALPGLAMGAADPGAAVESKITPAAGRAATSVGRAAQDAGVGLVNKTVGTLKADFKRGANPGRGYLESGNGPSLSMQSLAEKGQTALDEVGSQLGEAYKAATASGKRIPVDVVAQQMAKPIQEAIDLETGPGGSGDLTAIKSYVEQFGPTFEKAAQNGGFTPSELFAMKRSIAKNTNWSDPAQFNLKAVRQQQTGALSGILADAVPETADLNQMYQDLTKFTNRATERANTGSRPLTAHIYKAGMTTVGALAGGLDHNALAGAAVGAAMDSVPVKTAIGAGLFRGGKALSALGERLAPADGTPVEGVPPNDLGGNGANYEPGNPQISPPSAMQKWAYDGAGKLATQGLSKSDLEALIRHPQGVQILARASGLPLGSPALKAITAQAQKLLTSGN